MITQSHTSAMNEWNESFISSMELLPAITKGRSDVAKKRDRSSVWGTVLLAGRERESERVSERDRIVIKEILTIIVRVTSYHRYMPLDHLVICTAVEKAVDDYINISILQHSQHLPDISICTYKTGPWYMQYYVCTYKHSENQWLYHSIWTG